MVRKNDNSIMQGVALLASMIIALQMAIIVIRGDAFCLNQGCRIVEKLTTIPPLFFNLAGLFYFFVVMWVCRWYRGRPLPVFDWLRLLLLIGLTAEGVLVGYQIFVVQTLCSYCLIIFSLIVLLNILHGRQQLLVGVPLFFIVLVAFAVLNFGPALLTLQNQSLGTGTLAVKRCVDPAKKLYFFFSADCPHCQTVLKALENCNSCEFHFNPIDRLQSLAIPDLHYTAAYDPALNRLILSLLQIETIPVLLVHQPEGLNIIKGEQSIIRFISQACFREDPILYMDSSQYEEPEDISVYDEQEGDCTIQVECPDPVSEPEMPFGGE
jgi:hypothetical protein